jgi:hypothetical protein
MPPPPPSMATPRYRCRWNWGGGGRAGIRREIKRNKGEGGQRQNYAGTPPPEAELRPPSSLRWRVGLSHHPAINAQSYTLPTASQLLLLHFAPLLRFENQHEAAPEFRTTTSRARSTAPASAERAAGPAAAAEAEAAGAGEEREREETRRRGQAGGEGGDSGERRKEAGACIVGFCFA